ncbi:MAG: hypothetical protein ACI4EF_12880 [Coprococcus sp.]
MAFKFINNKKKANKGNEQKTRGAVNPNGPVEIVSKNFTMTTNPNTTRLTSADKTGPAPDTWICWGCGHTNTDNVCPVCGKKKTN